MTKVAVLGAGNIGGTLGRKWAAAGHEVTFGVRQPSKPDAVDVARKAGAAVATIEEAVDGAQVVVFAVPGGAMEGTVSALGAQLEGKVVVDAANNMGGPMPNSSAAFAAHAPSAYYYRAFSSLGWELLDRPLVGGDIADLFFCGPDGETRQLVEQLIKDVGLRPMWLGGPEEAAVVDGMTTVWFTLVFKRGHSRRLAFKVLED
jgi:predicted dinucleotide-binding enzyme